MSLGNDRMTLSLPAFACVAKLFNIGKNPFLRAFILLCLFYGPPFTLVASPTTEMNNLLNAIRLEKQLVIEHKITEEDAFSSVTTYLKRKNLRPSELVEIAGILSADVTSHGIEDSRICLNFIARALAALPDNKASCSREHIEFQMRLLNEMNNDDLAVLVLDSLPTCYLSYRNTLRGESTKENLRVEIGEPLANAIEIIVTRKNFRVLDTNRIEDFVSKARSATLLMSPTKTRVLNALSIELRPSDWISAVRFMPDKLLEDQSVLGHLHELVGKDDDFAIEVGRKIAWSSHPKRIDTAFIRKVRSEIERDASGSKDRLPKAVLQLMDENLK